MVKHEQQNQPFREGQRFNPYGIFKGIYIPDCVAKTKLLTPVEKLIFGRLCKHGGENGLCYPSFTEIAKALGISRGGAIKCVASLVSKGFLEKCSPNKGSNHYVFLWHPCLNDGLKFPGQHSVPEIKKASPSSVLSEPRLVYGVDQSSIQSGPKEIYKKIQKETTTAIASMGGDLPFLGAGGGCGFSLSEKQSHYIQLQVEFTAAHGDLRKPPRRLEKALVRLAAEGKLDMSDYSDLVKWKSAQAAPRQDAASFTLPDKAALHAEIEAVDHEARKWLASLPQTHPANSETKPSLMTEGVWNRFLYQKYHQSEGMKDVA